MCAKKATGAQTESLCHLKTGTIYRAPTWARGGRDWRSRSKVKSREHNGVMAFAAGASQGKDTGLKTRRYWEVAKLQSEALLHLSVGEGDLPAGERQFFRG